MKYSPSVESVSAVDVDLVPQRPKPVREQAELPNHILEPAWQGTRALVRIGHDGPRFVGYDGPVALAPDPALFKGQKREAIVSKASATLDSLLGSIASEKRLAAAGR